MDMGLANGLARTTFDSLAGDRHGVDAGLGNRPRGQGVGD